MNVEDLKRLKRNQDRQDFERCARACGYCGSLIWNEELQCYDSTHDTALFAGFKMGMQFKEAEDHGN